MGNSSYKPFILKTDIELQEIVLSSFVNTTFSLSLLREDQIHPFVSGNKFRKLKYNIEQAVKDGHNTLLTFGGAYSNHIAAVAAAGKLTGLETIGIIRGEELSDKITENPTLSFAQEQGMQLHFITRKAYRDKFEASQIEGFRKSFGNFYLIPEGGTNNLAVKGCEEIISEIENSDTFDYICAPVGTGGTIAGLIEASKPNQKILGFSALKGNFLTSEVKKYTSKTNFE
ncbi:MAG TPA: 1-aminocyclopropane-1-carboxylate deaminase, partial [Flavobacteriaceae bacterium]|nr:1-aminocyclopropane-1-carboxylate deaminase [Flavobacteriaceae bacterium]